MKIGFVLDDSLDSSDGVQQYILTLGSWLVGKGHEVHYLVGQTKRRDIAHIHSLSRNVSVTFNANRMSIPLPASRLRLQALLNKEQFDVLHIQMPYSPMLGAKLIRHAPLRTACVGTFHILPFGWLQRWGAQLLTWWLLPSLRRLVKVWSVSPPAQAFARQLGITSEVMPNVVELERFSKGKKLAAYRNNFTIVFLGRLVERKGCQELLQAVQILAQKQTIPGLKVVICGNGPQAERLQQWVTEHDLQDVVSFKGFITEEEKIDYLHTADVAMFPSLGGESFGIVLIEAMAAGAGVVLGGDNLGYQSVLQPIPDVIFDPRRATATAELIQKIRQEPDWALHLHRKQQELVKQYDVATVGKKLVSYYQDLHKGA